MNPHAVRAESHVEIYTRIPFGRCTSLCRSWPTPIVHPTRQCRPLGFREGLFEKPISAKLPPWAGSVFGDKPNSGGISAHNFSSCPQSKLAKNSPAIAYFFVIA